MQPREFFGLFEGIYCINLASRENKWNKMLSEFKKIGIDRRVVRFNAIQKENGHLGCLLSHRGVIQDAKRKGLKNILILEDDITTNIDIDYSGLIKNMPEYDILYLEGLFALPSVRLSKHNNNYYRIQRGVHGGMAIAYMENMYDILLEKLSLHELPFDAKLANYFQPKYRCFIAYPRPFSIERISYSDTEKSKKGFLYYKINQFGFWSGKINFIYPIKYIIIAIFLIYIKSQEKEKTINMDWLFSKIKGIFKKI